MKTTVQRAIRVTVQLGGVALLIWLDQLLKRLAVQNLQGQETRVLIPHVLGLTYAENTGAAFSLFSSSTGALSVVTAVLLSIGVVALIVVKRKPLIYDICIPLIIAGGAGNLLDRVVRGYVVDYIRTLFIDFPVFNFADMLITCSCIAVIVYLIADMIISYKKRDLPPEDPYADDAYADQSADGDL